MRYSRQELVIGKAAQKKLEKSTVAVVGLGALGSVAAELLARAGVNLTILDRDIIELTNLQRQTLYGEKDRGKTKAEVARKKLKEINSTISIRSEVTDLNHNNIHDLLNKADLILDCTDNLYTRYLIDEYAEKNQKPWVYGGAIKDIGNVMAITPSTARFSDLFTSTKEGETCDTVGVLNTATALIATLQVNEAIKILTGTFSTPILLHVNLTTNTFTSVKPTKRGKPREKFPYLSGEQEPQVIKYQCDGLYQFYKENIDLPQIKKTLENIGEVKSSKNHLFFENLSVFSNGRIFVKAKNEGQAKATIAKYIGL